MGEADGASGMGEADRRSGRGGSRRAGTGCIAREDTRYKTPDTARTAAAAAALDEDSRRAGSLGGVYDGG